MINKLFRFFFPQAKLADIKRKYNLPNSISLNIEITKDNWYKTELYRKRVYGEYLRIKKYSEKGDIASYLTN